MIHRRLHTDMTVVTDGDGKACFCGIYGDCEVEMLKRAGDGKVSIVI